MSIMRSPALLVLCLLLGCNSGKVAKQSAPAEKLKEPLAVVEGNVAMAFSPDGKWLAVGAELVDTSSWKTTAILEPRVSDKNPNSKNHWGYASALFSADSKRLLLGDQLGFLRILDVPSMQISAEIHAHGARITGIGFGTDNETVLTTSIDDTIRSWNSRTKEELIRKSHYEKSEDTKSIASFSGPIDVAAYSSNQELFAATDITSRIVIGTIRDGKFLQDFKGPGEGKIEMDAMAFSHDSQKLLVAATPNIYLYNVSDAKAAGEIKTKADSTLFIKAIPNSDLIAMFYRAKGFNTGVIELYDLKQGKSLGTVPANDSRGNFWNVSPDGQYIATVGNAGPIHVWSVKQLISDLTTK